MLTFVMLAILPVAPQAPATPSTAISWAVAKESVHDRRLTAVSWAAAKVECQDHSGGSQAEQYTAAVIRCREEHRPLVVSVGCDLRFVPGAVAVRWDAYPGVMAPALVVGVTDGGQVMQVKVLSPKATNAELETAAAIKPPVSDSLSFLPLSRCGPGGCPVPVSLRVP